jgi:hypothetical protein
MKTYGRGIFVVGCGEEKQAYYVRKLSICQCVVAVLEKAVPKAKANGGYHVRC